MKHVPGSVIVSRGVVVGVVVAALVVSAILGVARYRALRAPDRPGGGDGLRVPLFLPPDSVRHVSRFRFSFDPPSAQAGLRRDENLDAVVAGAESDEVAFRRLMSWTRSQWEIGRPDPYPPPQAQTVLNEIRSGRTGGFCAQYSFVLAQAVQSFGRPARCVSIRDHEVVEAWLADEHRWVMLDPTLELQILDAEDRSLSALEIHRAALGDVPVRALQGHRLEESLQSYVSRYRRFAVWLRNAFVTRPMNFVDFWRYRVWFGSDVEPEVVGTGLWTPFEVDLYPRVSAPGAAERQQGPPAPW